MNATTSSRLLAAVLILVGMIVAPTLAGVLRPTTRIADEGAHIEFEARIPPTIGGWTVEPSNVAVVNPQTAEQLDATYSQTVSKTYVRSDGHRIMLSLAYGEDQSRRSQLHKPEICYPAQGFALQFVVPAKVTTKFGAIQVTRLYAVQNARHEPITYWMRVGNGVVRSGLARTIKRVEAGLFRGEIPDGLLFRVSDLSSDAEASYQLHDQFIRDLLDVPDPELHRALIGQPGASG